MAKFKKGSKAAKDFMRKIRNMKNRKVNKARSPVINMAKRRRSGRARKAFRSYRHSGSNFTGLLIGTAEYSAYKLFLGHYVDGMVGSQFTPFIELGGGYLLSKMKQPMLKNLGNVAVVMGAFQVITKYVAPALTQGGNGAVVYN